MLCIQCGIQNANNVSYCTTCGANLDAVRTALAQIETAASKPLVQSAINERHTSLILVCATFVGIVGFMGLIAAILTLARSTSRIPDSDIAPLLMAIAFFGLAGLFLIIRSMLRLIPTVPVTMPKPAPPQQRRVMAPQEPEVLPAASRPAEPYTSVVEHTTSRLPEYARPREPER